MSFLQIDHVTKYFPNPSGPGQVCIFRDATIKIEKGEFVTCIGHSGCGKSTLLNIIAGLETPTEGGIILNGREASGPGLDRMVVFKWPPTSISTSRSWASRARRTSGPRPCPAA